MLEKIKRLMKNKYFKAVTAALLVLDLVFNLVPRIPGYVGYGVMEKVTLVFSGNPVEKDSDEQKRAEGIMARLSGAVGETVPKVIVVNSEKSIAYTSVNGPIIITDTMLEIFDDDEIAFVLSHEVGHAVSGQTLERGKGISEVLVLASFLPPVRQVRTVTRIVGLAAAGIGKTLPYEEEADRLGYEIATKAGYDKTGGLSFFANLSLMEQAAADKNNNLLNVLFPHPDTEKRIDQQIALINQNRSESEQIVFGEDFVNIGEKTVARIFVPSRSQLIFALKSRV